MPKEKKRDPRLEAMEKRSEADDAIREALKLALEGAKEEALKSLKEVGADAPKNILEHIVTQAVRKGFNTALNISQGATYSTF